jgi:hypothetical protein
MIIVIEGVSACGKSTWCGSHPAAQVVPETGRVRGAPDGLADPLGAAAFWTDRNADRWAAACAVEQAQGLAICDTDPLKLHYAWCLWRIGADTEERWLTELRAARAAITQRRVGLADAWFVKQIEPDVARRQRAGDPTRRRSNFETHLRMQAPLMAWYQAISEAMPGRVHRGFPATGQPLSLPSASDAARYDLDAFDRAMALLPKGATL